jgi:uncharacterized protein DUF3152
MALRAYRWAALALATLSVAACGTAAAGPAPVAPQRPVVRKPPTATAKPPAAAARPPMRITYPAHGGGRWAAAPAQPGGPPGGAGKLLRYRVAVESDIKGLTPAAFGQAVATTLSDPQGWTAGGRWRFERVNTVDAHDFTIYLSTPDTRDRLCGEGTDGYTSCRHGDDVVLNVARWVKGIPAYGSSLATYRQYMVNHEVGHRLGRGHELCPGEGEPAPVMQQQTLGLHGCLANAWPYPDGHNYTGRSGAYSDRQPPRDRGNP